MESSNSGTFVGREVEINSLRSSLEHARAGHGRLVLLQGEPGMGKTRLCEEVADRARAHGVRVLWGRGYEEAGAPAFWPWVQVLRGAAQQLDTATRAALDFDALAPLLFQVGARQSPPVNQSPEARFRLFDASVQLLAALAQDAPLLIVLDDLQGADRSSLLLLDFVTRALRDLRILVVGTHRGVSRYAEHPLTQAILDLAREPATERLVLNGLSEREVAELVEAKVGLKPPSTFASHLHQRTEGNPLFVGELVRAVAVEEQTRDMGSRWNVTIPESVKAVINSRLAPLSAAGLETLRVAAVVGPEFTRHVVVLVSMIGAGSDAASAQEVTVSQALDEAAALGFILELRETPGRYRFSHALIQETLCHTQPQLQRAALHRRIGEALEQLPAPEEHLSELANHFLEAGREGDNTKAIHYSRSAGDRARAVLAYEEAVRLYQRALDLAQQPGALDEAERCVLSVDLGIAQNEAGDLETSKQTLLRAAELASQQGLRDQLARAALHFGTQVVWGEHMAPDHTLLQLLDSAAAAWEGVDSPLHARVLARLVFALRFSTAHERRSYVSRQALEMARRLEDPALIAEALHACLAVHSRPDNLAERLTLANEMAHRAEQARAVDLVALAGSWRWLTCLEDGQVSAAIASRELFDRLLATLRDPLHRWWAAAFRAGRSIQEGRFSESDALVQEALVLEQAVSNGPPFSSLAMMITLWFAQGRREPLEALLDSRCSTVPSMSSPVLRPILTASLARELGRATEARVEFEQLAAREFRDIPFNEGWLALMQRLAEVCAFLGDQPRAARLLELLSAYETRVSINAITKVYLGPISESLALLETTLSRWDEAAAHFEHALETHRTIGSRPGLARAQCEYARMLLARRHRGDDASARRLITGALATARDLDMPILIERLQAIQETSAPIIADRGANEGEIHGPASTQGHSVVGDPSPVLDAVFRREADYWTIAYAGSVARLKDSRGMRYLAHLLHHPGQEFLALDLVTGATEPPNADQRYAIRGQGVASLDAQAKDEYRRRLAALRAELDEAEQFHDLGRAERARAEIEFISRHIAAAVGLGGSDRPTGSAVERARSTVTKGIKAAIAKIGAASPTVGRYLTRTIRTGYFCTYQRDPDDPTIWQL